MASSTGDEISRVVIVMASSSLLIVMKVMKIWPLCENFLFKGHDCIKLWCYLQTVCCSAVISLEFFHTFYVYVCGVVWRVDMLGLLCVSKHWRISLWRSLREEIRNLWLCVLISLHWVSLLLEKKEMLNWVLTNKYNQNRTFTDNQNRNVL
jgi:hypothetical protein